MHTVTLIGIDLGKHTFHLYGQGERGNAKARVSGLASTHPNHAACPHSGTSLRGNGIRPPKSRTPWLLQLAAPSCFPGLAPRTRNLPGFSRFSTGCWVCVRLLPPISSMMPIITALMVHPSLCASRVLSTSSNHPYLRSAANIFSDLAERLVEGDKTIFFCA